MRQSILCEKCGSPIETGEKVSGDYIICPICSESVKIHFIPLSAVETRASCSGRDDKRVKVIDHSFRYSKHQQKIAVIFGSMFLIVAFLFPVRRYPPDKPHLI